MIITLWGKCGAGKWTAAKGLAEKLGYQIISIGDIKRELAKEMGITILEFDRIGREHPEKAKEFDLKYEEYQKSLDITSPIILDSRLGFRCQPNAFKVFLDVSDEVGAQRIYEAHRASDESKSYEAVLASNRARHAGHAEMYQKLYQVDIFDKKNYDLVLDTTSLTPEEVLETILSAYDVWRKNT